MKEQIEQAQQEAPSRDAAAGQPLSYHQQVHQQEEDERQQEQQELQQQPRRKLVPGTSLAYNQPVRQQQQQLQQVEQPQQQVQQQVPTRQAVTPRPWSYQQPAEASLSQSGSDPALVMMQQQLQKLPSKQSGGEPGQAPLSMQVCSCAHPCSLRAKSASVMQLVD